LIMASGDQELFEKNYSNYGRENAVFFLAFDEKNPNSIINSVIRARENARQVRESISKETWEILNDLYYFVRELEKKKVWKKESAEYYKQIKYKLQLLQGIGYDTSPRTQGWYFNKLGQSLERADKTSRLLDVKYHVLLPSVEEIGSPLDFLHWNALLKSVSGFNAYCRLYGKVKPINVVEYLVLNRYFPRSILFCLISAEDSLHEISDSKRGFSNPAEKAIGNLRADLEYAEIKDVFASGLHEYLDKLQIRFNDVASCVDEQYFRIMSNSTLQEQQQ
jgi:uncharacterized alpha-E superfamily protein